MPHGMVGRIAQESGIEQKARSFSVPSHLTFATPTITFCSGVIPHSLLAPFNHTHHPLRELLASSVISIFLPSLFLPHIFLP